MGLTGEHLLPAEIQKSAFLAYYGNTPQPTTIAFQLNPETIRRRIIPSPPNSRSSGRGEAVERISFVLAVDVRLGDGFFFQDQEGDSAGVLPFLSAVELLAYPAEVLNEPTSGSEVGGFFGLGGFFARLFGSTRGSPLLPVGLQLGSERAIPVKIRSVHITEQEFDSTLMPIRASVRMVMDVLTERESNRHPATREMHENYLRLKIQMANRNSTRADGGSADMRGPADVMR